jgi:hypothetical protein
MKTEHKLVVQGPLINGRASEAWITLRRFKTTSSVGWDVGSIDHDDVASQEFGRRIERAGFHKALNCWAEKYRPAPHRKSAVWACGSARWGNSHRIPHKAADELVELVLGFFQAAVRELPVSGPGEELPVFEVRAKGRFLYPASGKAPNVGCYLVFKCPNCGRVNSHGGTFGKKGGGDGHRCSHCPCWPSGYYIKET